MSDKEELAAAAPEAPTDKEVRSDSRIKTAFTHRPVEMLCAFSMLVGGMVIAIAGGSAAWAAGGSFAAGLGGVLFSWSMASLNSREQAAEILRPHLDTSSKLLGTVSGQIARTIQDASSGRHDPETAFALMRQANGTLYNIVSDIQNLTGTEFDATGLTDLIERLHELAERVSRDPEIREDEEWEDDDAEKDSEDFRSEIETLRRQIATQLTQRGISTGSSSRPVRVTCPECSTSVSVQLGIEQGSTSSPWCPACGARFNAHRSSDGSAFARTRNNAGPAWARTAYERILRHQGMNLPDPAIREAGLIALARAISSRPNSRAQSWEDLETAISHELGQQGISATSAEVKRLRQLGYRTRLYDLDPSSGIGLREGISEETVCGVVNRQLASRIFQNVDEDIDLGQLAEILFGDSSRTEEAGEIASEFDSIRR